VTCARTIINTRLAAVQDTDMFFVWLPVIIGRQLDSAFSYHEPRQPSSKGNLLGGVMLRASDL